MPWRKHDVISVFKYLPFVRLMLSALYKLESIECTVWRGVALPPDAMLGGKRVGQTIKWWCFISTTLTSDVLEKFIGSDEQKKNERTIFKIKAKSGVSIHGLSSFDNGGGGGQDDDDEPINPIDALPEDEVILLPGIVLEITSIRRFKGQNLTEVGLQEVSSGEVEATLAPRRGAKGNRRVEAPRPGRDLVMEGMYLSNEMGSVYDEVESAGSAAWNVISKSAEAEAQSAGLPAIMKVETGYQNLKLSRDDGGTKDDISEDSGDVLAARVEAWASSQARRNDVATALATATDGAFCLRQSSQMDETLVLCVLIKGKETRFRIKTTPGHVQLLDTKFNTPSFDTLLWCIKHLMQPGNERYIGIRLRECVPCPQSPPRSSSNV